MTLVGNYFLYVSCERCLEISRMGGGGEAKALHCTSATSIALSTDVPYSFIPL